MKTIYTYNGDLKTYFAAAEDFLSDHNVFNEDGTRIVFEGDNALDTYLSYLDKIKELDTEGKYKYLRQPIYTKYFEEATKILDAAGVEHKGIYNLSTYFQHLDTLIEIGGPKYLRIPVEEDFFEINTDTREIKAPKELAENKWVVGVKDDHLAEILWFKVNRFYDGQDLAVCFPLDNRPAEFKGYGQTYVQWQIAQGNVVKAYGLDVVAHPAYDEDYLYFGWYLRSTGEHEGPLQYSGDLTFSIRFQFHVGNQSDHPDQPDLRTAVLFSFNTKTLKLTILNNLIEKIPVDQTTGGYSNLNIENIADQSYTRPRFSTVFDSTDSPKAFIKKDLPGPVDLDENNQVILNVEAQGTGILKYEWRKDGNKIVTAEDSPEYIITYNPETKVSVIGDYTVGIGNEDPNTKKTRWITSDPAVILGPSKIHILPEKDIKPQGFADLPHILSVGVEQERDRRFYLQKGTLSYTWYKLPLDDNYKDKYAIETLEPDNINEKIIVGHDESYTTDLNKSGRYQVAIINSHNGEETKPIFSHYCTIKEKPQLPTKVELKYTKTNKTITAKVKMSNGQYNDLQFKWYKQNEEHSSTFSPDNEFVIKEPGRYCCQISQQVFGEWAPVDEQTGDNFVLVTRNILSDEF